MIVLLSPSKTQTVKNIPHDGLQFSTPVFQDEATELNQILSEYSTEELGQLMGLSPKLAEMAHDEIQNFNKSPKGNFPAAYLFDGTAYKALEFENLEQKEIQFAQEHLLIASGMYGLLRPLDLINPYRLEMAVPLQNPKGNNLYSFWKSKMTRYMKERVLQEDDKTFLDIAVVEYTRTIDYDVLRESGVRIVNPIFYENKNGSLRTIAVYAKQARGNMARYVVENKIDDANLLKKYNVGGYSYSQENSTSEKWAFIR